MTLRSMLNLPPPTDPREFDAKVADALRLRHANVHLVALGRNGQAQQGIDGLDPLAIPARRLVWQSTLQTSGLDKKLLSDLALLDGSSAKPSLFVYAVGSERDARIQSFVLKLSEKRRGARRCQVEVLFWDEIRQIILDNPPLGTKWYPELFPQSVGLGEKSTRAVFVADAAQLPDEVNPTFLALWQMSHLARICGGVDPAHLRDLRGALVASQVGANGMRHWPNGKHACIGTHWYYPNGEDARIGTHWYYPNREDACIGTHWYYPNGADACIGDTWYHPTGTRVGHETSALVSALGILGDADQRTVTEGLQRLSGHLRRLALVDLVWMSAPQPLRRSARQ